MSREEIHEIPFIHNGVTYKTWSKVVGDLNDRTRTPLIVVHGGPGLSHDYLLPHSSLAASASIPIIFYDQIGGARSSHFVEYKGVAPSPAAKNITINIDLFIDELINLINYYKISDSFDILGHSWGGILGIELASRRQPTGLKHLILADSLATMALWSQSVVQLTQELPEDVRNGILIPSGDLAKDRKALDELHDRHGCLCVPRPKEMIQSLDYALSATADCDTTVPDAMFKGELGTWSSIDHLDRILVPTFVIHGLKDIAQDFVVEPLFKGISKVKWVTLQNSSHLPWFEEPDRYLYLVDEFLKI